MSSVAVTAEDVRRWIGAAPDKVFSTWDCTFKSLAAAKGVPDFVAGHAWARVGSLLYLLPWEYHQQVGITETIGGMLALRAWCEDVELSLTGGIYVEDKANGPAVIEALRMSIPGLQPWPGSDPEERRLAASSKESRAHVAASFVRSNQVRLPSPQIAPWIGAWRAEVEAYPLGTYDDRVDGLSMAAAIAFLDARGRREDGYWAALARLGVART